MSPGAGFLCWHGAAAGRNLEIFYHFGLIIRQLTNYGFVVVLAEREARFDHPRGIFSFGPYCGRARPGVQSPLLLLRLLGFFILSLSIR